MIHHTEAFKRLKDETQEVLDFAILVSYAVPHLKHRIKEAQEKDEALLDTKLMPFRPDNFERDKIPIGKIKDSASKYKKEIAKSIRLVGFSYFEVYIGDVIQEILEFHAAEKLRRELGSTPSVDSLEETTKTAHSKLREVPKKSQRSKYERYQAELSKVGFAMPLDRAMILGLERMRRLAADYKASQIPTMLSELLGLELTESELNAFGTIRDARNRIAHGRQSDQDIEITAAIEANHVLRELARKIDQHVLEYWLIADPVSLRHASM